MAAHAEFSPRPLNSSSMSSSTGGAGPKWRFTMTSNRLRAHRHSRFCHCCVTLIAGSAFAADGANGKFKRRGNNAQLNTGTFQIVVPKADGGGSGRQVAKFVAPKDDRGNSSGSKMLFSISTQAPRADSGSIHAQRDAAKRAS